MFGKIDTFTCFNTLGLSIISLTKSCYPECERPTIIKFKTSGPRRQSKRLSGPCLQ